MNILVTGAKGFIGRNLVHVLTDRLGLSISTLDRESDDAALAEAVSDVDLVFHLAGVNRPRSEVEYHVGNAEFTRKLCDLLETASRRRGMAASIVLASSIQAESDGAYGSSKRAAEDACLEYSRRVGVTSFVFRLPNVFGKWCRPNYNSVVATFCYNICRNLPVIVHDAAAVLRLVYIDDVVAAFADVIGRIRCSREQHNGELLYLGVDPEYRLTVGELRESLEGIHNDRRSLTVGSVGSALNRALYATYISYLPREDIAYAISKHTDQRGSFAEFVKTKCCGQVSFFTALPGVSRGGHYHHSKSEKFLVVHGEAKFTLRNLADAGALEIYVSSASPTIVEPPPGWAHEVTNVGTTELVVVLWANEVFDANSPDTFRANVFSA